MKKLIFAVAILMVSGVSLAASSAATLTSANGTVMVNQGKQFVTAQPGLLLSTGDRVMVMEGGNASVRYAEGCTVNLKAGSIVTVSNQQACLAGNTGVAQTAPMTAQTGEGGCGTGCLTGIGVGVTIVAVALLNNDDQSSP